MPLVPPRLKAPLDWDVYPFLCINEFRDRGFPGKLDREIAKDYLLVAVLRQE